MERVTKHTSLHPTVAEKLEEAAKKNHRTVSNQIAELVKDGVTDGRYVIKGLAPELEGEMIASAKKENRSPENLIETALKMYLNRVEYLPFFR